MSRSGQWRPDEVPVVTVAVESLRVSESPRVSGENLDHVKVLAETEGKLPPIVVHRPTMRVIDGMHRLRATRQRGQGQIAVRFFDGTEAEAFILAVRSNITHGLPLSLADRKAAALRITRSNPHWSDRLIADRTGLAAKTVATVRRQCGADGTSAPAARVGQDGRVRPVSSTAGRKLAGELINENPGLSLRQVAKAAGISPETVRDVRRRLRRGENPALPRQRDHRNHRDSLTMPAAAPAPDLSAPAAATEPAGPPVVELPSVVRQLETDPALRFNETGRALLKILNANSIIGNRLDNILDNVPEHCRATVANAARKCAQVWRTLASELDADTLPA